MSRRQCAGRPPEPAEPRPGRQKTRRAPPGERRPAATAGGGRAGPSPQAGSGGGCPPTWRCFGLWRAPAGARSRRPPTRRGQPPDQGAGAPPPRRGREGEVAATTAHPGRPGPALEGWEWGRPGRRKGSKRRGEESFIFSLEKWREPRPFFKLGLGRGGSCATAAAPARPSPAPRGPGRARLSPRAPEGAFHPKPRQKAPSSPRGPCPSAGPAPTARSDWGSHPPTPRSSPFPGRPGAREARPGPQRAQPGMAARLPGRPGPSRAAHPGRLQTWLPALHNPLLPPSPPATRAHAPPGTTPADEELKVCFPPPHRLPRKAAGARGRQRVNPRALAPPSAPSRPLARLSRPSPRAAPFPAPGPENPGPRRWPPLHASHRKLRGLCLRLPGSGSSAPGGSSSSCPCFPLPPSSNLTFRGGGGGGRGVPACAARTVGRGLLAAEAGGAVLGSGRRAVKRAEPPEPSYSRERRETMEGKGGWSAALVSLPPPPAAAPHCA